MHLHGNKVLCGLAGMLGRWLSQDAGLDFLPFSWVSGETCLTGSSFHLLKELTAFTWGVLLSSPSSLFLNVSCCLMKYMEMAPFSPLLLQSCFCPSLSNHFSSSFLSYLNLLFETFKQVSRALRLFVLFFLPLSKSYLFRLCFLETTWRFPSVPRCWDLNC